MVLTRFISDLSENQIANIQSWYQRFHSFWWMKLKWLWIYRILANRHVGRQKAAAFSFKTLTHFLLCLKEIWKATPKRKTRCDTGKGASQTHAIIITDKKWSDYCTLRTLKYVLQPKPLIKTENFSCLMHKCNGSVG